MSRRRRRLRLRRPFGDAFSKLDNRLLPPLLITCILITAHLTFGILEAYERTALAIVTAIGAELAWAASPTASGCTRRARTSRASASASWSGRRFCGRTSLPA